MAGVKVRIYDAKTKEPVPFATIKFGEDRAGTVGGLDGVFELPEHMHVAYIEVSCLGYRTERIKMPLRQQEIYLEPGGNNLNEVVIVPPYDKMRHILNMAIANKARNNPDQYEQYRCHVYYKMYADISWPDSVMNDTAKKNRVRRQLADSQHLLLSETYSIRSWRKPGELQEDVLASRLSGLKKSMITSMATDVLPFHSYSDYLKFNGRDYHNPVSRGYEQYYKFNLVDELMDGGDTVWVLSFRPRRLNANNLTGRVYINSDGYAISQLIATARDTVLQQSVRIEQQYDRVPWEDGSRRWFPSHLNYIINWEQHTASKSYTLHMKGYSLIDSVSWTNDREFKFDKAHTIKLREGADELSDSIWHYIRPVALDKKEERTYTVIDSLGREAKADKVMEVMSKMPEFKLSLGVLNVDLSRLVNLNNYENVRLGAGLQTNERLVKWLSLGGWAGYGFADRKWKYGGFAEVYADRRREFAIRAGYTDDIADPGRIRIDPDLDKNYLRRFLLSRVDHVTTSSIAVRKKIDYWKLELTARQQQIIPQYGYALNSEGRDHTSFSVREASFNFRYAYAERTVPFFGTYYRMGSDYPVLYGSATTGQIQGNNGGQTVSYTQLVMALMWHKHINRLGYEHLQVTEGKCWSNGDLPLSKLFAGNGFKYDSRSLLSIYAFGGMMTMYPYEYYSDQFVNVVYRHDFDWKLYKLERRSVPLSSVPNICLQYGMLYGKLGNTEAHKYVSFAVPDRAYQEGGLILNNLLRLRSGNWYYLAFNIGYFYHFDPLTARPAKDNGRFVFGLGVDF